MQREEKLWAAAGHLSYLLGLPIIVPLLILLWKRDSSAFVAEQTKQAIGLHLAMVVAGFAAVAFSFATLGLGMIAAIPAIIALTLVTIVLTIIACIKISEGKSYHYPIIGEWIARF